jgi:hypothetical protein
MTITVSIEKFILRFTQLDYLNNLAMATKVPRQAAIDCFSDISGAHFGMWLLLKSRDNDKVDARIPRLWWALGCSEEAALAVCLEWTSLKKVPFHGFCIEGTSIGSVLEVLRSQRQRTFWEQHSLRLLWGAPAGVTSL